jgi:geranylgeranyl diphosphate synthase type I
LLVGDLLIIKGLTTARNFLESAYSAEKKRALFEVLQNFLFEIYEGELMDNACVERIDTELEDYTKIMWKLTADIEACTRMGAILGGGSENEIQALAEFGRRLCFVTKLGDELKDSLNREGSLSHRLKYESVPLPILYAAKSSKDAFLEIESILKRKAVTPDRIRRICWKTHAVTYVYNMAKQNATEATQKLQSLSPSTARDVLTLMLKVSLTYIRRECNLEKRYVECASS